MCIRDRDGGGFSGDGGGGGSGGRFGRSNLDMKIVLGTTIFFVIIFALLVIVLPLALVLKQDPEPRAGTSDLATDFYSPGDSRLLSFSSFFCDSLNIEVDSRATGAYLALVNSPPPLTDQNSFNISDKRSLRPNEYHFWQYHLYPNSKISVSVCSNGYIYTVVDTTVSIWLREILLLIAGDVFHHQHILCCSDQYEQSVLRYRISDTL